MFSCRRPTKDIHVLKASRDLDLDLFLDLERALLEVGLVRDREHLEVARSGTCRPHLLLGGGGKNQLPDRVLFPQCMAFPFSFQPRRAPSTSPSKGGASAPRVPYRPTSTAQKERLHQRFSTCRPPPSGDIPSPPASDPVSPATPLTDYIAPPSTPPCDCRLLMQVIQITGHRGPQSVVPFLMHVPFLTHGILVCQYGCPPRISHSS